MRTNRISHKEEKIRCDNRIKKKRREVTIIYENRIYIEKTRTKESISGDQTGANIKAKRSEVKRR